jgi:hypothetical protein
MQCPACKAQLTNDLRYCLHCGQYLGEITQVSRRDASLPRGGNTIFQDPTIQSSETQKSRNSLPWLVAAGAIVLVVILLVGIGIYNSTRSDALQQQIAELQKQLTRAQTKTSPTPAEQPKTTPTQAATRQEIERPNPAIEASPGPRPVSQPSPVEIVNGFFHVSPGSYYAKEFLVPVSGGRLAGSFNSSTPIEVYVIGQTGKLYDSHRINSGSIKSHAWTRPVLSDVQ